MTEIKRAKRVSKRQTRSELCQFFHQIRESADEIKQATNGIGDLFDELVNMNIALQNENEQLRVALQNSKMQKAGIPRRESAKTFQGKSIE